MKEYISYCPPFVEKSLQYHGHKEVLGVTFKTYGSISEGIQVSLVWLRTVGYWEHFLPTKTKSHKDEVVSMS